jgi:hypothetical protein
MGILMGRQTVSMVTQTINDLYYTTTVQAVGISVCQPGERIGIGAAGFRDCGCTASLGSGFRSPAGSAYVRSTLEQKSKGDW